MSYRADKSRNEVLALVVGIEAFALVLGVGIAIATVVAGPLVVGIASAVAIVVPLIVGVAGIAIAIAVVVPAVVGIAIAIAVVFPVVVGITSAILIVPSMVVPSASVVLIRSGPSGRERWILVIHPFVVPYTKRLMSVWTTTSLFSGEVSCKGDHLIELPKAGFQLPSCGPNVCFWCFFLLYFRAESIFFTPQRL